MKRSFCQVTVRALDLFTFYKDPKISKLPAKSFWSQGRSLIAWSSLNVTFLQELNKDHSSEIPNTIYLWLYHRAQAKVCPEEWQEAGGVGR